MRSIPVYLVFDSIECMVIDLFDWSIWLKERDSSHEYISRILNNFNDQEMQKDKFILCNLAKSFLIGHQSCLTISIWMAMKDFLLIKNKDQKLLTIIIIH